MTKGSVEIRGLTKVFGSHVAVDAIDLDISPGEFVAVLGPSGSGKSTVLRMIGGHVVPDEGDIRIDGQSIAGLPPNRIPTATVFQDYALFPHYTVLQNVMFGLRMHGMDKDSQRSKATESLELVDMGSFAQRRVTELSGGERQRVAAARALAVEPAVLLMDEPLGALDRLIKIKVQQELADLLRRIGMTTLYVTHDQREALTMADRVAVLSSGRVEQIDDPVELSRTPANEFVANFLGGSTNYLDGTVITAGNAKSRVKTEVGEFDARNGACEPHQGDQVRVHVRPEDLKLVRDTDGAWSITRSIYTGELSEIDLEGPCDLIAKTIGHSAGFESGTRVRVAIDDDSAILMPGPGSAK